ncbi:MAG: hypothetical protein IPJ61_01580 [Tessaracoccus sp.]|uniref:hypothetical protein n=1 Tax=Tessaracoccus sp. TaxID=1971211 RepID=UPI001EBE9CDF|nr:hypothetical protein [Tessaracoccus sp.]MBK7819785.1 hypothetical protein [Tessaracoccus sp.]
MLKHSAARVNETRTATASDARTITTVFAVAAVILGLGVALTLASPLWFFVLFLTVVGLGVASEVRAARR